MNRQGKRLPPNPLLPLAADALCFEMLQTGAPYQLPRTLETVQIISSLPTNKGYANSSWNDSFGRILHFDFSLLMIHK